MKHETNQIKTVNIGNVDRPNPPIRGHFDKEEMARLVASIKDVGLLVPLMVRERDGRYEVIDGDRRLAAAWEAGEREIPVVVRALNDKQTHIQRMLANKDREDTDPVSEAKYISQTIADKTVTIEEWCEKMGRSNAWVSDRLEVAEMPEYMQLALSSKKISLGVCMELNLIKNDATKERYFYDALRSGMTVHAARVSRMAVNEAIEAIESRGDEVTENNVPEIQTVPRARCAYTGEVLPITGMRMVRVGIDNHENWQRELQKSPTPIGE